LVIRIRQGHDRRHHHTSQVPTGLGGSECVELRVDDSGGGCVVAEEEEEKEEKRLKKVKKLKKFQKSEPIASREVLTKVLQKPAHQKVDQNPMCVPMVNSPQLLAPPPPQGHLILLLVARTLSRKVRRCWLHC
jgi:hypothetical protein